MIILGKSLLVAPVTDEEMKLPHKEFSNLLITTNDVRSGGKATVYQSWFENGKWCRIVAVGQEVGENPLTGTKGFVPKVGDYVSLFTPIAYNDGRVDLSSFSKAFNPILYRNNVVNEKGELVSSSVLFVDFSRGFLIDYGITKILIPQEEWETEKAKLIQDYKLKTALAINQEPSYIKELNAGLRSERKVIDEAELNGGLVNISTLNSL